MPSDRAEAIGAQQYLDWRVGTVEAIRQLNKAYKKKPSGKKRTGWYQVRLGEVLDRRIAAGRESKMTTSMLLKGLGDAPVLAPGSSVLRKHRAALGGR